MSNLAPGTLVRARQRDWVVLPQTTEEVVRLRPVDGTPGDAIGLFSLWGTNIRSRLESRELMSDLPPEN